MSVRFTRDVEKERTQDADRRRKARWELLTTPSLVQAVHYARDNGWEKKKVQVRKTLIDHDTYEFSVEPFEKDCSCPDILKFNDYFDEGSGPTGQ